MAKFVPKTFTVSNFSRLYDDRLLELVPKFQRRPVWQPNAKSYFIDTLIRGLPSPKIYLREKIGRKRRLIREVVDGQQRLRTVLEFMHDEFTVKPRHNETYGGIPFSQFPPLVRGDFLSYVFSADIMVDASDDEVLDMFTRLNQYTVTLNNQEKRNARFHGEFKSAMYSLASKNLSFFRENRILSERNVVRMIDAEFVSELVVAMMSGLQDKKKSLNHYYRQYDAHFPGETRYSHSMANTISHVQHVFGDTLLLTKFRKRTLFYSLFCVMFDLLEGLPGQPEITHGKIGESNIGAAQQVITGLSEQIEADRPSPEYVEFVKACKQQTDNVQPRQLRHDTLKVRLMPLIRAHS
jgi:hypothetical protein